MLHVIPLIHKSAAVLLTSSPNFQFLMQFSHEAVTFMFTQTLHSRIESMKLLLSLPDSGPEYTQINETSSSSVPLPRSSFCRASVLLLVNIANTVEIPPLSCFILVSGTVLIFCNVFTCQNLMCAVQTGHRLRYTSYKIMF